MDDDEHNIDDYASHNDTRPSCLWEFYDAIKPCQPWFECEEPSTQRILDIPDSFGPRTPFALVLKFLACGYILSTQIYGLIDTSDKAFYWAYFTIVALTCACLYSVISLSNSIFRLTQPDGVWIQLRVKMSWILFICSAFGEALATAIFWLLVYEWGDVVEYQDAANHGIVFVVVLLEGMVVNRIPLRWTHLWLCWALVSAYIIWTVIHGPLVLDMGNPNEQDNDPETNDDAIYPDLSWKTDDISSTVILTAIVYFVVVPFIFAILLAASIGNWFCCSCGDRRRYIQSFLDEIDRNQSTTTSRVEDPSIADGDLYTDKSRATSTQ